MNDEQQHTLRTHLLDKGLDEQMVYDIMLLLRYKPDKVQLAFYYVTLGFTQDRAAVNIGVKQATVNYYLSVQCADIKKYIEDSL